MPFRIYTEYNNRARLNTRNEKLSTTVQARGVITFNRGASENITRDAKDGETPYILLSIGDEVDRKIKIQPTSPYQKGAIPLGKPFNGRYRLYGKKFLRAMELDCPKESMTLKTTFDGESLVIDVSPLFDLKNQQIKRSPRKGVNSRPRKMVMKESPLAQNNTPLFLPEVPDTPEQVVSEMPVQMVPEPPTMVPESPTIVSEPPVAKAPKKTIPPQELLQLVRDQYGDFASSLLEREIQKILPSEPLQSIY